MKIQQIRNATIVVHYAGKKILIDPMLAEKGAFPPFPNSPRQDEKNPLVNLPVTINELTQGLDAVIVTHLHYDHWDEAAKELLQKDLPIFAQNDKEAAAIRDAGFQRVEVLQEETVFEGIQLTKTTGQHGRGDILQLTGQVCGVVFQHPAEKTLYVAGDTVWYEEVRQVIDTHQPEIIVVNAGDNQFFEGGSLVMGKEDVLEVHQAAPLATIIAVHMEAVNHWALSRTELKKFADEKGISTLLVPDDGEEYTF